MIPEYVAAGIWSAEMSGRYPGVMISSNKLSVRVSPICLSELVAILAEVGIIGCVILPFNRSIFQLKQNREEIA